MSSAEHRLHYMAINSQLYKIVENNENKNVFQTKWHPEQWEDYLK